MSRSLPERRELIHFLARSKPILSALQEKYPAIDGAGLARLLGAALPPEEPQNKPSNEPTNNVEGAPDLVRVFLHTDGACRGNPGPSGAGWVFSEPGGSVFRRGGSFLGRATNNEAEYVAAILGLEDAVKAGFLEVVLHADSELMVKQINGVYRVKNPRMQELHRQLKALASGFRVFKAVHVRREFNQEADREANRAIDDAG